MLPSIKLVAWESRDPNRVFVAIPNERGRYLYTHRSVVLVACPYCKATVGEPCKNRGHYNAGVHYHRPKALRGRWPLADRVDDKLFDEDKQGKLFEELPMDEGEVT